MEDFDDDFDYLYADVEMQANTAINCVSKPNELQVERDENTTKCADFWEKNVAALEREANGGGQMGLDYENDSEDEFRIVVNDGDEKSGHQILRSGGFHEDDEDGGFEGVAEGDGLEPSRNGCGSGERGNGGTKGSYPSKYSKHKCGGPHMASFSSNTKVNGSGRVASVRGDWDDDECNQRMFSGKYVAQGGNNISLPRHRTILDVNIDAFEPKPWKNLGADATEFFNFGFDQESWKQYCCRLEQLQKQNSLLTRMLASDCPKPRRGKHAPANNERGAHKAMAGKNARIGRTSSTFLSSEMKYREVKQFEMLKGRVVQVEDSLLERQPSTGIRCLVDRDSDVIQIVAQDRDLREDASGSVKEESTCKSGSDHEASEKDDFGVNDDREICQFGNGSGDELSADLEQKDEGSMRASPKRSSQLTVPSNKMSPDLDNHENGQIAYRCCHQKATGSSLQKKSETIGISNCMKEKIDRASTYSGSHYEAYVDGAPTYSKMSHKHLRQTSDSVDGLKESVKSEKHHLNYFGSNYVTTKSYNSKEYARSKSLFQKDLKSGGMPYYDYYPDSYYRNWGLHFYDKEDGSYYKDMKRTFDYYHEMFSCKQARSNNFRKPQRKHQRFRDEADQYHRKVCEEGENISRQRMPRGGNEASGGDWHHNRRGLAPYRHIANCSSSLNRERSFRWRRKGDGFQFRKRTKKDDLVQEEFGDYCKESNYSDGENKKLLLSPNGGRIPGRNEGKGGNSLVYSDNAWSMSNGYEYWRFTDHRFLSHSFRKPNNANRGRGHGPFWRRNLYDRRNNNGRERHWRFMSRGRSRGDNWFVDDHDFCYRRGSFNCPDGQIHFGRRHWQPKSSRWTEDECIFGHGDREFFGDDASISIRGTSNKMIDAKQKLINDREIEQRRIKPMGEGYIGNCIEKSPNVFDRGGGEKTYLSGRDSGDLQLVAVEGKSPNAGTVGSTDKHEDTDEDIDKEQTIGADHHDFHVENASQDEDGKLDIDQSDNEWLDNFPITQPNEVSDVEEGQIITEELNEDPITESFEFETFTEFMDEEKNESDRDDVMGCEIGERLDDSWIFEVMAKMEKRRERFKEPIALKNEAEKILKPPVVDLVETAETKQERPSRKRRWGEN